MAGGLGISYPWSIRSAEWATFTPCSLSWDSSCPLHFFFGKKGEKEVGLGIPIWEQDSSGWSRRLRRKEKYLTYDATVWSGVTGGACLHSLSLCAEHHLLNFKYTYLQVGIVAPKGRRRTPRSRELYLMTSPENREIAYRAKPGCERAVHQCGMPCCIADGGRITLIPNFC